MWYLVISKPAAPQEQIQQYAPDHAAWLKEHHAAGDLVFTGPIAEGGGGIWVLRASSREAAQELLDQHPWHSRGLRTYEMYGWAVNQFMGEGPFGEEALQALQRERSGS